MILNFGSVLSSRAACQGLPAVLPLLAHIRSCQTYRQAKWSGAVQAAQPNPLILCSGSSIPELPGAISDEEQQQNRELFRYRTEFPDTVWQHIAGLLQSHPFPTAVDMGFAALGAQQPELQQLGFRVADAVPPGPADTRAAAYARLPSACSDIVTCLPGPPTPHANELLTEARRLMCKGGFLAVAWNDRDLTSPLVSELESLLEAISPDYCRSSRQHNPPAWANALTDGGSLQLVSFTCHPQSLLLQRCAALQDLLGEMTFLRPHLAASSATRKHFHKEVRALVERHCDPDQPILLPLVTKLYVLKKKHATAAKHLDLAKSAAAAAAECQQAASLSTVVGSECGVGVVMSDEEQEVVMQPLVRTRRHGCSLHF